MFDTKVESKPSLLVNPSSLLYWYWFSCLRHLLYCKPLQGQDLFDLCCSSIWYSVLIHEVFVLLISEVKGLKKKQLLILKRQRHSTEVFKCYDSLLSETNAWKTIKIGKRSLKILRAQ